MRNSFILFIFFLSTHLMASTHHQLALYFIPSPLGMDWSNPSKLAFSALKNKLSFQSRFMGHVFVELQCDGKKELTGMVGKNFDYLTQLLVHQRGLGILYHSFEGTLEDQTHVQQEINELSQTGERINLVRFKLNSHQCTRAMTYLKEYRDNNVGRYYGLANRPLYAEGAGCSAFGASFLEVLGLMDQELRDAWSQTINIPLEFAGPPLNESGVNLIKLILNASSWASEGLPHKKLTFWEPDRMFRWVNEQIIHADKQKNFTLVQVNQAKGIEFDRSHLPAPSGPIWLQHLDPSLIKPKK